MKVYAPLLVLVARPASTGGSYAASGWSRWSYAGDRLQSSSPGPSRGLSVRDPGGSARFSQTSVLNNHALTPGLLVEPVLAYFSPRFWFVSGDGDPMHLPAGEGFMPVGLAPLLVVGLIWLCYTAVRGRSPELKKASSFLLLAIALRDPIAGAMTLPNPQVLRAVHVLPIAAVVAGAGAVAIFDFVSGALVERGRRTALSVAAGLPLFAVGGVEMCGSTTTTSVAIRTRWQSSSITACATL